MRDFLIRLVGGALFWFAGLYLLIKGYENPDWFWIILLCSLGLHLVAAAAAPRDYDGSLRGLAALYVSNTMDNDRLRVRAKSLGRTAWILFGFGIGWLLLALLSWRENAFGPGAIGLGLSIIFGGVMDFWSVVVTIVLRVRTHKNNDAG